MSILIQCMNFKKYLNGKNITIPQIAPTVASITGMSMRLIIPAGTPVSTFSQSVSETSQPNKLSIKNKTHSTIPVEKNVEIMILIKDLNFIDKRFFSIKFINDTLILCVSENNYSIMINFYNFISVKFIIFLT